MLNHVLSRLSDEDRGMLLPQIEEVTLAARQHLEYPDKDIDHIYFMEAGFAAVVSVSGHTRIALGLIGCEGASGIAVMLGNTRSPHETVMLTDGRAWHIGADVLRAAMDEHAELRRLLLRYCLAFFNQAAHTALSNAASTMEQRVARWVLMTYDRFAGDEVPLTHDMIAYMLGVRRPSVTEALDAIQQRGLIAVRRGCVALRDRDGLRALAGHFYGIPEKEFVRLVGTFWPPIAPDAQPPKGQPG